MPELGKKYTCYSCHTKFYDLGKPVPLCPKCGADQRDAEDTPIVPTRASRSAAVVVEEPAEEREFSAEGETTAVEGDEDEEIAPVREEEADEEDDEEEEEY